MILNLLISNLPGYHAVILREFELFTFKKNRWENIYIVNNCINIFIQNPDLPDLIDLDDVNHVCDEVPICSSGTQYPLYIAASLGLHVIGSHANPARHQADQ